MGQGMIFECKRCGNSFNLQFGSGMLYPTNDWFYKINGIDDVLEFVKIHPEGVVECEKVVKRCKNCGELLNEMDFSMYLPKGKRPYNLPDVIMSNFTYGFHDDGWEKVKEHSFQCDWCGHTEMDILNRDTFMVELENGRILCPWCRLPLSADSCSGFLFWD